MTSLSNLPDHLVLEQIFTRLPVKYLIVLTSVCKSRLASISSRSFVETHLSRFHLNPDNHLLLFHHPFHRKIVISPINLFGNPHSSIIPIPASEDLTDPSDFRISRNLSPSSQNFLNSMQTVVGSINGLVCSFRPPLRPTNVVIWNPTTHRSKDILVPHFNIKNLLKILVAFGFDCVVNDYKIVCIYEFGLELQNPSYQFRMYSCNDKSWKELKPDFPLQLGFVECVTVKGNPYWMCLCNQRNYFWVKINVETEGIKRFDGPEYVKNKTTKTSILALGDSVAQAVFSPGAEANDMIHVYTFEENSGVWMRMYTFELLGVQRPVSFKCYKNGKIIYTTGNHNKMFMYNLTSGEVKKIMVTKSREMHYMPINYTESLVAIEGMVIVRKEAAKEERQETAALATTNRFLAFSESEEVYNDSETITAGFMHNS